LGVGGKHFDTLARTILGRTDIAHLPDGEYSSRATKVQDQNVLAESLRLGVTPDINRSSQAGASVQQRAPGHRRRRHLLDQASSIRNQTRRGELAELSRAIRKSTADGAVHSECAKLEF
jgi:hypothetical protein